MRPVLSLLIGISLLATIPFTYIAFHHHNTSKTNSPTITEKAVRLYTPDRMAELNVDEYWLSTKIQKVSHLFHDKDFAIPHNNFKDNPFRRLINKDDYSKTIQFTLKTNPAKLLDYYQLTGVPVTINGSDKLMLKNLYCDTTGYTDEDFKTLQNLHKNDGSYLETHYLVGLLFLQKNHCYDQDIIKKEIKSSATAIITAEKKPQPFSDLYAERIAVLYWAGYGKSIRRDWIETVVNSFSPDYGWSDPGNKDWNAHATSLALLSLIYYQEGKPKQPVF